MGKYKCVHDIPHESCLWQTNEIVFTNRKMAEEEDCDGQDTMRGIMLKDLPRGEYFKYTPYSSSAVYKKGYYDLSSRRYMCTNETTGNERAIDGNKIVYAGFWY